jgi:NADPH:quinone reductase-like Zn-dependent oxidoreductase
VWKRGAFFTIVSPSHSFPIPDNIDDDLTETFAREAGDAGFDVIIDYLWGTPTEALLAAIARRDLNPALSRIRLIEACESAGPTISLAVAALRTSRLEILGAGSGNAPASPEIWLEAVRQLMSNVASGKLRIDTERVPRREVEDAWQRDQHRRRTVIIRAHTPTGKSYMS